MYMVASNASKGNIVKRRWEGFGGSIRRAMMKGGRGSGGESSGKVRVTGGR